MFNFVRFGFCHAHSSPFGVSCVSPAGFHPGNFATSRLAIGAQGTQRKHEDHNGGPAKDRKEDGLCNSVINFSA